MVLGIRFLTGIYCLIQEELGECLYPSKLETIVKLLVVDGGVVVVVALVVVRVSRNYNFIVFYIIFQGI